MYCALLITRMYRFVEICVRYDFKLCMVEVLCENTMVNILYEHVLVHKVFKTLPYVDLFYTVLFKFQLSV